jgi:hypothetical protein
MTFYRTTNSSIHAGIANSLKAGFAQPARWIPTTSRASSKTPPPSDIRASISDSLCLLLGTRNYLFPWRSNSPSTAAAPPPAAAITPVCCAKIAFLRFLPQLSSPPISDFSQKGRVKLTNLPNFSPFLLFRFRRFRRQSLLNTGRIGNPIPFSMFNFFNEFKVSRGNL